MLRLRTHIIFWVVVALVLFLVFGGAFRSFALSFYFVTTLLPVALGTSIFFNFYLVPRYLFKKRYFYFILYSAYLLIFSLFVEMWVIFGSFILLVDFNYSDLSPLLSNVFILTLILYLIVLLMAFLLLLKRNFQLKKHSKALTFEKNKFRKGYITVRSNRRNAKILFEDIEYIESLGDYIKIVTTSGDKITTNERISHIIKELPGNFMRIHRSFIVNSHKIDFFSKTQLKIDGTELPISRTYKKQVSEQLSK